MGGTADRPGLFIQSDTMKGSTSLACSTFREFWPLGRELEFKITQLEIWAVKDNEAQEEVEQDVRKLISNTQYMRMGGDEIYSYNEKRKLKLPSSNQPEEVPDIVIDKTSEMTAKGICGPLICCGECAMSYQPKYGPSINQRRVCCSKRCKKKIEERCSLNNPRGEGDGYKEVQTVHRYPRQEAERRQCRYKYSEERVKMKQGNRIKRISLDARQKHGAASGFIHPSLAAEENERNAREAKDAKALSPSSTIISKSNRSKTSKKYRSSFERDPSGKSNSPTFNVTHNKTQVGECRLMKPTCKLYKHENKCACVTKKYCACTPKETFSGRSKKLYSVTANYTKKEIIGPERNMSNENISTKTAKNNFNTSEVGCNSVRKYACRPCSKDFTAESSSTVFIELTSSCRDEKNKPAGISQCNSTVSETSILGNKSKVSQIEKRAETSKRDEQLVSEAYNRTKNLQSESSSKMKEKVYDNKGRHEDKSPTFYVQASYSSQNIQENKKFSLQELMQDELDCHCSSSSDCDVEKRNKKYDPASICNCEAKVSNYLSKINRTDIPDVPLSEISSSVCSCILDNKNKIIAQSSINSSKKENQSLNKSRKKSDGSSYSVFKNDVQPKKTHAESLNTSFALKKETQLYSRSRRASTSCSLDHSNKQPTTVPPTCLRCKTLVSWDGCQCEAQPISSKATHTLLETSHLVQKELVKTPSTMKNGGNRRSVVIDTEAMSFDGSKLRDKESLSESISSRIISRASSQYSEIKADQKKSCKTSCKCSLARSYFPVFPEDLIKEGGISEDCDCASYNNLRFPIIVETPPQRSPQPSEKSQTTMEPDQANKQQKEEQEMKEEQKMKDKDCECNDNDNTIIILNVSKCNAAETVQKIVQELEEKTGETSNPNVKSLVFKCKDFAESRPSTLQHSPHTSKSGAERELLRQHIDKILKGKTQVTPLGPDQEEQP